jgi:TDG/mug DNA glycosylase family protein
VTTDRTAAIYETHARQFREQRTPDDRDAAADLGRRATRAGLGSVVDLGCGPGWYTAGLGPGAIALDYAAGMLAQVPDFAPDAVRVQASLAALPFRRGGLGGAYAGKSYIHVAQRDVPLALADLHRALAPGAPVELVLFSGDQDLGPVDDDDYPGRQFSLWPEQRLVDVVVGAGFTIDELSGAATTKRRGNHRVRATRLLTLPDTVGPRMRLLVCGLNPSVYAAERGVGFARPGNRFWPAAISAGLVERDRDPWAALRDHGVGMTDVVKRATPRADELTTDEYRGGMARIERLIAWLEPAAVCFVGLAGWRAAVDRMAVAGAQPDGLGGVPTYVMPSTSGVNGHTSLAQLADHLRAAAALGS